MVQPGCARRHGGCTTALGMISDLTGNCFWPPPQTLLEPCTAAQIAAYTQQLGESSVAAEELVVGGQSRPEPR